MKDMIIKLHLPDAQLERLLDIAENAGMSVEELMSRFLMDLTEEDGSGSLEEWISLLNVAEEDMDAAVTLSKKQLDLMSLMDQILDQ